MRPPRSAGSQEKLLFYLKTKGPQTATQLAKRLNVTAMAVRQHLAKLAADKLVEHRDEAGRVGRPRRIWSLGPAAHERFPDSHAELALGMIDAVRESFGPQGLKRLIEARTAAQVESYSQRMPPPSAGLAERVSALAAIRREEGYLAEWSRSSDGGLKLIENHCPICSAVESCVGLCEGELELFERLLGAGTDIERTEYMVDGDRRCSYRIRER